MAVAILMFLPENANGWEQEDFSKSQIQNQKQGSLAKGIALIEDNFHVAKHCAISKVCVQSRGLGILICETCSCSTSDLGCVFMRVIMLLTPQFPFLSSGKKIAEVILGLRSLKHYFWKALRKFP